MVKELEKKYCPKCQKQYEYKRTRCSTCRVKLEHTVKEPRVKHYFEYESKHPDTDRLI